MINFRLIRHLWLFLAVAEEENFGRAAKRLGMSQPPLTEQIQVLEQALKVRLFDRSRKGARLTAAGAAILPAVRRLAEQLERVELAVSEAILGHSGMLTIGAISTSIADVLPSMLERLKKQFPGMSVSIREIDSVEAVPLLLGGDIDVAFARLEGELGHDIGCMPLTQDRLAVALPHDHPLGKAAKVSLAALAQEVFVTFSRRYSPVYFDSVMAACNSSGFSPRVLHEARSVASQVAFVGCGQGIALVPSSLRRFAPQSVVIRPLKEKVEVVTTAMAWNHKRPNAMVQMLAEGMAGQAHTGFR